MVTYFPSKGSFIPTTLDMAFDQILEPLGFHLVLLLNNTVCCDTYLHI
jgi:hypothetical protein